jgi:hypothetical protein
MQYRRTRYQASIDKRAAIAKAEAAGQVADSLEVRRALLDRVAKGEMTLLQANDELDKIKRNANKVGLVTRSQVFDKG